MRLALLLLVLFTLAAGRVEVVGDCGSAPFEPLLASFWRTFPDQNASTLIVCAGQWPSDSDQTRIRDSLRAHRARPLLILSEESVLDATGILHILPCGELFSTPRLRAIGCNLPVDDIPPSTPSPSTLSLPILVSADDRTKKHKKVIEETRRILSDIEEEIEHKEKKVNKEKKVDKDKEKEKEKEMNTDNDRKKHGKHVLRHENQDYSEQSGQSRQGKLACKYRKECYQTGQLPAILNIPPSKHPSKEPDHEKPTGKLSCKYRKSCYESGEIPQQLHPSIDHPPSQQTERKAGKDCKYRKSCYETGRLADPVANSDQDEDEDDPGKKVTSSKQDDKKREGKLECKYRSSCYESGQLPKVLNPVVHKQHDDRGDLDEERDPNDKVACKYRKSCYETGKLTLVVAQHNDASEDEDDDEEDNPIQAKLQCKYRRSCYEKNAIHTSEKKNLAAPHVIAGKSTVIHGNKTKLSNMADKAIKKAEQHHQAAPAQKPRAEVILDQHHDKMAKQLNCKYRKSCYESGELPAVLTPVRITTAAAEPTKNFDEMEPLEQKLYCRYRKSCYDDGIRPVVEKPDPQQPPPQPPNVSPKVLCKYRKSCYETGIPPTFDEEPPKRTTTHDVIVPASVNQLRTFCKYRKSCYHDMADHDAVEKIKKIQEDHTKQQSQRPHPIKINTTRLRKNESAKRLERRMKKNLVKGQRKDEARRAQEIEEEERRRREKAEEEERTKGEADAVLSIKRPIKHLKREHRKNIHVVQQKSEEDEAEEEEEEEKADEEEEEEQKVNGDAMMGEDDGEADSGEEKEDSKEEDDEETDVVMGIKANGDSNDKEGDEEENEDEEEKGDEKEEEEKGDKKAPPILPVSERLACKYRQSCYVGKEHKKVPKDAVAVHPPKREPVQHPEAPDSVESKLECKYRYSCYEESSKDDDEKEEKPKKKEEKPKKKEEKPKTPPAKCHKYLLSCRETLGLPPKEKVPIGPNGRKLCRKQKGQRA